jgi:hypothetical protein
MARSAGPPTRSASPADHDRDPGDAGDPVRIGRQHLHHTIPTRTNGPKVNQTGGPLVVLGVRRRVLGSARHVLLCSHLPVARRRQRRSKRAWQRRDLLHCTTLPLARSCSSESIIDRRRCVSRCPRCREQKEKPCADSATGEVWVDLIYDPAQRGVVQRWREPPTTASATAS